MAYVRRTTIAVFLTVGLLPGCASISSTVEVAGTSTVTAKPPHDGLTYFMPRRPYKVSITIAKDTGLPTVTVTAGDAVPDTSKRFSLSYGQNYMGTNHAILTVNTRGLLQSSTNSTTSATNQIATAIGTLAATVSVMSLAPGAVTSPAPACVGGQTYVGLFFPEDGSPSLPCQLTATLARTDAAVPMPPSTRHLSDPGTAQGGVFFRRDIAYQLSVADKDHQPIGVWQVYSPDESEVMYYPLTPTVFANNQVNFTFADGVLTGVDQSTDSEILGALQFPANVISGYTSALGNLLGGLSNAKSDQSQLLANQQAYLLAKVKLQACQTAITANDPSKATAADAQATATAAVKAACQ